MAGPPSFRGKLQGVSTVPDDLPGGQFRRNWRLKIEFGPADPSIEQRVSIRGQPSAVLTPGCQ